MQDEHDTKGCRYPNGQSDAPSGHAVRVAVEMYQSYLDGSRMTEEQKEQYIEALWHILLSFVELGFGVHLLRDVCE